MSITLAINGNSSLLVANYFPPIELKQDYICGLISFDSYHTIPNVDKENNLFHIGSNVIEIPVGTYELSDIAEKICEIYEPMNQGFIDIKANTNTFRTEISSSREEVNFEKEYSIGSLLGFTKRILKPGIVHYSNNPVDITKVNTISVECNIINDSYINGISMHTIHQFSLRVSPGYKISEISVRAPLYNSSSPPLYVHLSLQLSNLHSHSLITAVVVVVANVASVFAGAPVYLLPLSSYLPLCIVFAQ